MTTAATRVEKKSGILFTQPLDENHRICVLRSRMRCAKATDLCTVTIDQAIDQKQHNAWQIHMNFRFKIPSKTPDETMWRQAFTHACRSIQTGDRPDQNTRDILAGLCQQKLEE